MTRDQIIETRQALVSQLPVTGASGHLTAMADAAFKLKLFG
jgi:predicted ABC-class ATPase